MAGQQYAHVEQSLAGKGVLLQCSVLIAKSQLSNQALYTAEVTCRAHRVKRRLNH